MGEGGEDIRGGDGELGRRTSVRKLSLSRRQSRDLLKKKNSFDEQVLLVLAQIHIQVLLVLAQEHIQVLSATCTGTSVSYCYFHMHWFEICLFLKISHALKFDLILHLC